MDIRVELRLFFIKIKTYFTRRYKKLEWKVSELDRIHNAIANSLTILIHEKSNEFHERLELAENEKDRNHFLEKEFKNESRVRKGQVTKLSKKLEEFIKRFDKDTGNSNANFKFMNDKIKKLLPYLEKVDEYENLCSMLRKEIGAFHQAGKKFDDLDALASKVKIEYDRYLKDLNTYHQTHLEMLHRDISEYKKNDNAVVRLASLESRITMLEIKQKEMLNDSPNVKAPHTENYIRN